MKTVCSWLKHTDAHTHTHTLTHTHTHTHIHSHQWKRIENLEIYLHTFGQRIAKEPRIFHRESTVSSINGSGKTSLVGPVVKNPAANSTCCRAPTEA